MGKSKPLDICEVLRQHIYKKYGSQRAAAEAWGKTQPFVCEVLAGRKAVPDYMAVDAGYQLVQTEAKWVRIKK